MSIHSMTRLNSLKTAMKQTTNLTHVQFQRSRKKLPQKFWGKCLRTVSVMAAGALLGSNAMASQEFGGELYSSNLNLMVSNPIQFSPTPVAFTNVLPTVWEHAWNRVVSQANSYTPEYRVASGSAPLHGSVSFNAIDNTFTYMPNSGEHYYGEDSFKFQVRTGTTSHDSTYSIDWDNNYSYEIKLLIANPVLPTATDYTYSALIRYNRTTPITGTLPAGDDGYGGALAPNGLLHMLAGASTGATVTVAEDGTFTYIPPHDFHGTDTFTYGVNSIGSMNSVPATVYLTIAEPILPTAADQTFTMTYNQPTLSGQLDTAVDPSNVETVTYLLAQNSAGIAGISPDGQFTYTRNGSNASTSFGFWVQNSQGMNEGTYHTAYINIDPAPAPLTNNSGLSFEIPYDAVRSGNLPTASDPSGNNLELSYVLSALNYIPSGQSETLADISGNIAQLQGKNILTLVENTGAYTFNAQNPGVYEAYYHVHNSIGDSANAIVRFTVQNPLGFIVDQNETLTINSKITGPGPLVLRGGGLVHLDNTEPNDYTIATIVEGGTVLEASCNQLGLDETPVHLKDGMIKSSGTWSRLVKLG